MACLMPIAVSCTQYTFKMLGPFPFYWSPLKIGTEFTSPGVFSLEPKLGTFFFFLVQGDSIGFALTNEGYDSSSCGDAKFSPQTRAGSMHGCKGCMVVWQNLTGGLNEEIDLQNFSDHGSL